MIARTSWNERFQPHNLPVTLPYGYKVQDDLDSLCESITYLLAAIEQAAVPLERTAAEIRGEPGLVSARGADPAAADWREQVQRGRAMLRLTREMIVRGEAAAAATRASRARLVAAIRVVDPRLPMSALAADAGTTDTYLAREAFAAGAGRRTVRSRRCRGG